MFKFDAFFAYYTVLQ